jgi:hypothetical protein
VEQTAVIFYGRTYEFTVTLSSGRVKVRIGVCWGNVREGDHLEDPSVNGRIILKWVLQKWGHGLDRSNPRKGQMAGCYECGNEPSGSIK